MIARSLRVLSLASLLLSASVARAEYGEPAGSRAAARGFSPGVRFSYAQPLGELVEEVDLDEAVARALKVQLDLDYGLSSAFAVGLYFALGGGFLPKSGQRQCDMLGADCGIMMIESGLQAAYRLLPDRMIDPWLGANLGLEWVRMKTEAMGGAEGTFSYLGILFGPSLGVDVQMRGFAFGPYFSPQFGQYLRSKLKVDSQVFSESRAGKIDDRAFHYWMNFGVRARYQF